MPQGGGKEKTIHPLFLSPLSAEIILMFLLFHDLCSFARWLVHFSSQCSSSILCIRCCLTWCVRAVDGWMDGITGAGRVGQLAWTMPTEAWGRGWEGQGQGQGELAVLCRRTHGTLFEGRTWSMSRPWQRT